jgi:hypothetical protein
MERIIESIPEQFGYLQEFDDLIGKGHQSMVDIDGSDVQINDYLKVRGALVVNSFQLNSTTAFSGNIIFSVSGKVRIAEKLSIPIPPPPPWDPDDPRWQTPLLPEF